MQRLFTALSLPQVTAKKLTALQPAEGGPVQVVEASQLHITLHFIGQAETLELAGVLEQVRVPAFPLQIDGLGKFSQPRGAYSSSQMAVAMPRGKLNSAVNPSGGSGGF